MSNSSRSAVFVGRQPIYDRNVEVAAYELLYRTSCENRATIVDGDVATSQLLISALIEIGLESLVADRPAFVNFTRNFLTGKIGIPFEPRLLVIEVLETVEPDEEVVKALQRFRENGFTIALDDYVESDHRRTLIDLSDIIKVDISTYDAAALEQQVRELRLYPVRLLAEKVETAEEFQLCKALGFDYFQGYFLSRPQIVEGKTISHNQVAILQLLAKLRDPEVSFDDIVELVKQDVSLSVKLLRYVNSINQGVRRTIDSVRQATVRLGMQKIRQIVTLFVMTGTGDTPKPLVETALTRARMCELLGVLLHPESSDVFFTVGLFSILDVLMGCSLTELLPELPVTPEIRDAVLNHEGEMGRVLACVIAFERGDWDKVRVLEVDSNSIQRAYVDAVAWGRAEARIVGQSEEKNDSTSISDQRENSGRRNGTDRRNETTPVNEDRRKGDRRVSSDYRG